MADTHTPRSRSHQRHAFERSLSPSGRFCSSSISSISSPTALFHRQNSPTRVCLSGFTSAASPHRSLFSLNTDISVARNRSGHSIPSRNSNKKTCMCSPTTHPGSFRCSLHKNAANGDAKPHQNSSLYQPHRLHMRRSAMTNSLVRIGTVEGDWVRRALATLIRPSSHQQRRRGDFQPRPSRLSVMSTVEHACGS